MSVDDAVKRRIMEMGYSGGMYTDNEMRELLRTKIAMETRIGCDGQVEEAYPQFAKPNMKLPEYNRYDTLYSQHMYGMGFDFSVPEGVLKSVTS